MIKAEYFPFALRRVLQKAALSIFGFGDHSSRLKGRPLRSLPSCPSRYRAAVDL